MFTLCFMLVSSYFCREFWHFFYWSDTFAHLWRAISHDTSHISHLRRNIWSLKMRDGTISREINEFSIQLSHKTRNNSLNSDHTALKRRRNVKYIYTCISCASKRVIHQNILAISTTRHISLQLQSKIKCCYNRATTCRRGDAIVSRETDWTNDQQTRVEFPDTLKSWKCVFTAFSGRLYYCAGTVWMQRLIFDLLC